MTGLIKTTVEEICRGMTKGEGELFNKTSLAREMEVTSKTISVWVSQGFVPRPVEAWYEAKLEVFGMVEHSMQIAEDAESYGA